MDSVINTYGDRLVSTTGHHGADIASQRIDDLDRRALLHAIDCGGRRAVSVDLGCGLGVQGVRLSLLGMQSYLYDLLDEPPLVAAVRRYGGGDMLRYQSCDLSTPTGPQWPSSIDLVFSQRFIHYLRYAHACRLLKSVVALCGAGSPLFVSASGLDSELGDGYEARHLPVQSRFRPLNAAVACKHDIHEPVCLYREGELSALLEEAGCSTLAVWRSAFGNIKGVFRAPV